MIANGISGTKNVYVTIINQLHKTVIMWRDCSIPATQNAGSCPDANMLTKRALGTR